MPRRLVVDANRILSALIRDGATRRALVLTEADLYAPTYLLEELVRHRGTVLDRAPNLTEAELDEAIDVFARRITWIDEAALEPYMDAAEKAIAHVDPKDVRYLACALAVRADAIWSHDAHFDQQVLVRRVSHPDLVP